MIGNGVFKREGAGFQIENLLAFAVALPKQTTYWHDDDGPGEPIRSVP